jgi:hypothetical protein
VWLTGIRLSPSRPPQAHHTSRQQRCGGGSRVWVAEPVLKPCNHGVLDSQAPGRHRRRDRLRRRRNLPKRRSAAPAAASATAAEVDRSADRVSALTQVAGVLGSQWGDEGEGQARRRARPPASTSSHVAMSDDDASVPTRARPVVSCRCCAILVILNLCMLGYYLEIVVTPAPLNCGFIPSG